MIFSAGAVRPLKPGQGIRVMRRLNLVL